MMFCRSADQQDRASSCLSLAIMAVIGWYLVLCAAHYFNQRPLWNDEECVLRSVRSFDRAQMFGEPLLADQVFPRVYLFLIQQFAKEFDYHLLSLRFFSFLSMIAAFLIWLRVAARELKDRLDYSTFALCWPASALLIYYSAELKQYSMDVLAGALFLFFLYQQESLWAKNRKMYAAALLLLPLLGFLSYPAFLFMGLPFIHLWRIKDHDGRRVLLAAFYALSLACVVICSYLIDLRYGHSGAVIQGYGDYFISFRSVGDFFQTLGEGTMNLFSRWFAERPRVVKKVAIFFLVFGLLEMWIAFFREVRQNGLVFRSIRTIALAIFFELLLLGALRKYPFSVPRTSLFFCPMVLVLTVQGIGELKRIHPFLYRTVQALFIIFLIVVNAALARQIFNGDLGAMPKLW